MLPARAPPARGPAAIPSDGLLAGTPAAVAAVRVDDAVSSREYAYAGGDWYDADNAPVPATLAARLDEAVRLLARSPPVRTLPPEAIARLTHAEFGLAPPRLQVTIDIRPDTRTVFLFGDATADGIRQYAAIAGRGDVYVMSGFVGAAWRGVMDAAAE